MLQCFVLRVTVILNVSELYQPFLFICPYVPLFKNAKETCKRMKMAGAERISAVFGRTLLMPVGIYRHLQ